MKTRFVIVVSFLCLFSIAVSATGSNQEYSEVDREYLRVFGLDRFPTQDEIVQFLLQEEESPELTEEGGFRIKMSKQIFALGFLRYHWDKYPNAKETVFAIFQKAKCNERNSFILKLSTMDTLSSYGECSWIPVMKKEIDDPNSLYDTYAKIRISGRMANCGDSSKLEYTASFLNDDNEMIRNDAIRNLMYFISFGDEQAEEQALELLGVAGKTDPAYHLRDVAIQMLQASEWICIEKAQKESGSSLYRLEQKKAKIQAKMKEVIESNLDSPNEELKTTCQNLMRYKFKGK